jgi:tyrosine-protein kinase Etk/Wzc
MTDQQEEKIIAQKSDIWRLSIKEIFFKYVVYLPLFILSVAIALLLAYLYYRYSTPIYSVRGTMLVKDDNAGGKGDKFQDLFYSNGAQNLNNEIEILKSRAMAQRVVTALNLQVSYVGVGKIRSSNIYKDAPFRMLVLQTADTNRAFSMTVKTLANEKFRINNGSNVFDYGQVFQNQFGTFRLTKSGMQEPISPNREYIVSWTPVPGVAAGIAGALRVAPVNIQGNVLQISMETDNYQLGEDIINQLMEEYGKSSVEDKSSMARKTIDFIDERLRDIQKQLDTVESKLMNFRETQNVIDTRVQSNIYLNNIQETDRQLAEVMNKKTVAEFIEDYVRDRRNTIIITPSAFGLEDIVLNKLVSEYNEAQQKREDIARNSGAKNPLVIQADAALEIKRSKIMENIRKIKGAYQLSIDRVSGNNNLSQSQVRSMPAKERQLAEIQREQIIKANLFEFLFQKKLETEISKASTISNSKVVDAAINSGGPIRPNKRAIQVLALLLGLAIPALLIFVKEILNDKVTTRSDIEKITQAPILAEIGHSMQKVALVATKNNRSMISEQFRIMRTNLQYILNKAEKPVIMVTSSFSGEGKSFISTNLAAVMALAGKRTVVLEFDIRKPKIISGLGIEKRPGITNFILGNAKLEDLAMPVKDVENLFVIACGPVPPNPAELLLDQRLPELFAYARENFDVVIIDTAPVGLVSDAMVLGNYADSTLYIVRQGYTFKKQIGLINEFYTDKRLPRIAIVINDVSPKRSGQYYGYGGYGGHGYGYGYGYGYFEEDSQKKPGFFKRAVRWLNPRSWFS